MICDSDWLLDASHSTANISRIFGTTNHGETRYRYPNDKLVLTCINLWRSAVVCLNTFYFIFIFIYLHYQKLRDNNLDGIIWVNYDLPCKRKELTRKIHPFEVHISTSYFSKQLMTLEESLKYILDCLSAWIYFALYFKISLHIIKGTFV